MNIIMICGLCITAAVLCKVVEKDTKEFAVIISIAAVVLVLLSVITRISEITQVIEDLFAQAQIPEEYGEILFKSVGICYITQIGSDCCKDCGESNLAFSVEIAGKISILALTIPAMKALIVIIENLLK